MFYTPFCVVQFTIFKKVKYNVNFQEFRTIIILLIWGKNISSLNVTISCRPHEVRDLICQYSAQFL